MTAYNRIRIIIKENLLNFLVIILFCIFFFALHFNSFMTPWERDEGEYAYSARLMAEGKVPYHDSFIQKPPLIIYTYYLADLIKPQAFWPPRLLGFLFTLATCFLLCLISRKLYGPLAGWLALWISPLFLTSPPLCALAANTEKFMLLPLVGLLALFVFKREKEHKTIFFWAGALGSLAILYKPIALPAIFILLAYWLVDNYRRKKDIKEISKAGFYMFSGGLITTFLSLFYIILNGAAGEFWQQAVVFNASYAVDMSKYFPGQFFHYFSVFWQQWPIILILSAAAIFYQPKLYRLWLLLLLASLLSIITTPIGHYYLVLMPFLILLAVGAYSQVSLKISGENNLWAHTILSIFIILMISFSFLVVGEQLFLNSKNLSLWIYGRENPFIEAELMAEKIKEKTGPSDLIFVAGSEPQIYYFSGRQSASRFSITYPLIISTPWREDYQRQAISDLEQNKPAAIVVSSFSLSGLWDEDTPRTFIDYLQSELEQNYYYAGQTALDYFGRAIWLSPEEVNKQNTRSLFLYFRKR